MSNFFKSVTVEPSLLFFVVVQEWMYGLDSNLFLQKACRFDTTSEPDLNTKCDDEKRGIIFVSESLSTYDFAVSFISMVVMIFASIWSDEAGRRRRLFIFLPICGLILHTLSGCLNSYFWHWLPSTAVLLRTIIRSFCAGRLMMVQFSQIYLCEVTDGENRTARLLIVTSIKIVGVVLGNGAFGSILRSIGFFYFYSLCFTLSLSSFLCGLIFIKDSSVPVEKKIRCYRVFGLKRILLVDSFKVVFNRKLGMKRTIVLLLLLADVINGFTIRGEMSLLYLYLRHRFNFDEPMYSRFMFCKYFLANIGIVFCSFLLSKRLKMHDGLIGILATVCDTLAMATLCVATEIWHLYSFTFLDMFHGAVYAVNLSFMSKYYSSNELGRLNAVNSAFLLVCPLAFPVYNKIFQQTLDTFPSAYCFLSIVLDIGISLFFFASYWLSQKLGKKEPVANEEESMVALK